MAKVLGESGRYVSHEAFKQSRRIFLVVALLLTLVGAIEGYTLTTFIPARLIPSWLRLLISIALLPGMWPLYRWGSKKLDLLDKRRADMRRGAAGEIHVGMVKLPRSIPTLASNSNCVCSSGLGGSGVQTDTKTDTNFPIRKKPE
jgi:hypothetical protein